MMQRTHQRRTPLTPEELAKAREEEQQRKRWDPGYVTAAEARDMPRDVASRPDMAARIQRSQPDWPENRMSATEAHGPLEPGTGEQYLRKEQRAAETLFTGEVSGGPQKALPDGS